jgi:endonuclease YncB( thermonuclease family)
MGTAFPFRRLRWGPPRKLPTPHFLRERRPRLGGLSRYFGFLALAALMGVAAFAFEPWRGAAHTVNGLRVTVIDGDSLRAGNDNIRLIGIDAPELRQSCRDEHGREWTCGRAAKARLAALIGGAEVACTARGHDRYGRTLAVCSAGDIADLGETLVREGYAVDYYQGGYQAAEREARTARRGLWRGDFERPQDWRRRHPRAG